MCKLDNRILSFVSHSFQRQTVGRLTSPWRVGLWCIHPKGVCTGSSEISSGSSFGRSIFVCILNYQCVMVGEEISSRCLGLVKIGVPGNSHDVLISHVCGDGVQGTIRRACSEHIDGCWFGRDGGEIPTKCDIITDAVVLGSGEDIRRDHRDAAGWESRIVYGGIRGSTSCCCSSLG